MSATLQNTTELIQVTSANQLELLTVSGTLTINAPGPQGPPGATGPQGPTGNSITQLSQLEDVLLVNLADANLIKYSAGLQKFTNTNVIDAGSF